MDQIGEIDCSFYILDAVCMEISSTAHFRNMFIWDNLCLFYAKMFSVSSEARMSVEWSLTWTLTWALYWMFGFFCCCSEKEWKLFNFSCVMNEWHQNETFKEEFWNAAAKPHINCCHQSSSDSFMCEITLLNHLYSSTHALKRELVGPLLVEHCDLIVPPSCQY